MWTSIWSGLRVGTRARWPAKRRRSSSASGSGQAVSAAEMPAGPATVAATAGPTTVARPAALRGRSADRFPVTVARAREIASSRQATLLAVVAIGLLALVVRLAFTFRAPPFVTNDSLSYLLPGFDLIHGNGFAPILKRPPLYPLFVGGALGAFGEDLRVVMLVQHLLGVGTVLLTFGIGRLLFGTGVGLLAALLTALSGPVIVTEHYLMSEALFTLFLLAGLLVYLAGVSDQGSATGPEPGRTTGSGIGS